MTLTRGFKYYIWYTHFMEMKTSYLIFLALILSIIAGVLLRISAVGQQYHLSQIATYADCIAAGNPVLESYPTQCKTPDGRTFVNPAERVDTSTPSQQYVQDGCVVTGCSKEVCTDAAGAGGVASPCIYMAEFACYKTARCERQNGGACGWTRTPDLIACFQAAAATTVQPISD
jgi:hypothetical protein